MSGLSFHTHTSWCLWHSWLITTALTAHRHLVLTQINLLDTLGVATTSGTVPHLTICIIGGLIIRGFSAYFGWLGVFLVPIGIVGASLRIRLLH